MQVFSKQFIFKGFKFEAKQMNFPAAIYCILNKFLLKPGQLNILSITQQIWQRYNVSEKFSKYNFNRLDNVEIFTNQQVSLVSFDMLGTASHNLQHSL